MQINEPLIEAVGSAGAHQLGKTLSGVCGLPDGWVQIGQDEWL